MLILNIATVILLSILAALLFFRKNNVLPNKILAFILITPALNFLANIFILTGNLANFPFIYFFAQTTGFVFAPLVHMYVLLITGETVRRYWLYYVSALGMLASFLFAIDFTFAMSPTDKEEYLTGIQNGPYPIQMVVINSLFILFQQIYFTIAAIHVYKYRNRLSYTVSNYQTTKVHYVTIFIILIWLLNIITIAAYIMLETVQVEYIVLPVVLSVISAFIIYYGFRHQSIFTKTTYRVFLTKNQPLERTTEANASPGASMNSRVSTITFLDQYLQETQAFSYSELNLAGLAASTGITESDITASLKNSSYKNFYTYINTKRASKAALLLNNDVDKERVALQTGFTDTASMVLAIQKFT